MSDIVIQIGDTSTVDNNNTTSESSDDMDTVNISDDAVPIELTKDTNSDYYVGSASSEDTVSINSESDHIVTRPVLPVESDKLIASKTYNDIMKVSRNGRKKHNINAPRLFTPRLFTPRFATESASGVDIVYDDTLGDDDTVTMPPTLSKTYDSKNRWTRDIAINLQNYAFKSNGSWWINGKDANFYNKRNSFINLLIVILSAISSAGIASVMGLAPVNNDAGDTSTVSIIFFYLISGISLSLSLTTAVAQGVQEVGKYSDKASDCKDNASKYGELYRKITNQFRLEPSDRIDALVFQNYVTERFDELEREKPFIRDITEKEWHAKIERYGKSIDEIVPLPSEFLLSKISQKDMADTFDFQNNYRTAVMPIRRGRLGPTPSQDMELDRGSKTNTGPFSLYF
jgi:hypothetical protein